MAESPVQAEKKAATAAAKNRFVYGQKARYLLDTDQDLKDSKYLHTFTCAICNEGEQSKANSKIRYPCTQINRNNVPDEIQKSFASEIKVCMSLNHVCISTPQDYGIDSQSPDNSGLYIFYSTPVKTDLRTYLREIKNVNKIDYKIIKCIVGIAAAVSYLHSNGFVCGDLRPESIYFDQDDNPVLINYNLPEFYPCPLIPPEFKNTIFFAPEFKENYIPTEKSDAYSFGCLLGAIKEKTAIPSGRFFDALLVIISCCTNSNPAKRLSFTDIEKRLFDGLKDILYIQDDILYNWLGNIIASDPKGTVARDIPYKFSAFADDIMTNIDSFIQPLKSILPSKIITKTKRNIHLRLLLISLMHRNTEMVCNWIMDNYKKNKMQDIHEIMDAIMQTTIICYQNVDIYSKLTKNLTVMALKTNKLGYIPTYILHKVYATFVKHDPFSDYMPYVSYLQNLFRRKVFNLFEICQLISDIYNDAPTPLFAVPLFIWFSKGVQRNDPDLYQKMSDYLTKEDVRPIFKAFHSGESDVTQLASIIMKDDVNTFKYYIKDHPDELTKNIQPTVFEVCPYAKDDISVAMYVLLYNATKIYTYLCATTSIYDNDDPKIIECAIVGNHQLYLEQHKVNTAHTIVVEASVKFHNYQFLLDSYKNGIKLATPECLFSAVNYANVVALMLILSGPNNDATRESALLATKARAHFGETIFQAAVQTGDFLLLRLLVNIPGVNPFSTDSWGQSALHWAARIGSDSPDYWEEGTVRYPWWFGSDLNIVLGENMANLVDLFKKYQNPGSFAAKLLATSNYVEPFSDFLTDETLVAKFGKVETNMDIWRASSLRFLRRFGSPHCLKLLLKVSKDRINDADELGMTPLHYAAASGAATVMKMLVGTIGIDVNVQDKKGRTPLHYAARNDDALCYAVLLQASKLRQDLVDHKGRTAYELAVLKNCTKVLDLAEQAAEKQCRIF